MAEAAFPPDAPVRQITLMQFRADVPQSGREALFAALRGLPAQTGGVLTLELLCDLGLSPGCWDFAMILRFEDAQALREYKNHPAHLALIETLIRPAIAASARVQTADDRAQ